MFRPGARSPWVFLAFWSRTHFARRVVNLRPHCLTGNHRPAGPAPPRFLRRISSETVRGRGQDQPITMRQSRALLALALASILCTAVTAGRALYTGRGTFLFFCWNLFLAWVPVALALALARHEGTGLGARAGRWALGAAWLAFFPNAPYLVTDLVHLRARSPVPLWFDALLVFGFALTGLCLAFVSLRLVHDLVERSQGRRAGWCFVALVAGLTGVGIYLGRFLRWNSWDLVTRPDELFADAAGWVLAPREHAGSLAVAAAFGGIFGASYLMLFALTQQPQSALASVGGSLSAGITRQVSTTSWPSRR
jgi:uncharacterized membrane protein